ncbi:hypothetical protein [Streptomyces sp. NPDC054787]
MFMHKLRRRMSAQALGTVLALSIALPIAAGATPAYAVTDLQVTKSHEGTFVRGGQAVYHIVITNSGTTGEVGIEDILPEGLTMSGLTFSSSPAQPESPSCFTQEVGFFCSYTFPAGSSLTVDVTADIAADAPCGPITNEVEVREPAANISVTASDTATVTGTGCPNGDGDGDGSILPVNLNGVVTVFDNINTNNNVLSPGATNTTHQNLGISAP